MYQIYNNYTNYVTLPCQPLYCKLYVLFKDLYNAIHSNIRPYLFSRWLNDHARKFTDVSISNVTDEIGTLGIAGPRSRDVLSKLTDTNMSHGKFKFLTVKDIEIAGISVKAMRLSYTGTQLKMNNLFWPDENSIEQCFAAHIVQGCQQYCSTLLHLIAGLFRLNNTEQYC